jgi:hypothetical protein
MEKLNEKQREFIKERIKEASCQEALWFWFNAVVLEAREKVDKVLKGKTDVHNR